MAFKTILVAEDEDLLNEIYIEACKEIWPESKIISAKNGLDAIEKSKGENLDLIISDINMPKMNGIEMASIIRNMKIQALIVFISAEENVENCSYLNPVMMLRKPVSFSEIIETLKSLE